MTVTTFDQPTIRPTENPRARLEPGSIAQWQRRLRCETAWPAGTSFPDLESSSLPTWVEQCSTLQSLMGVDQDWPSGTSFADVEPE
jgi:hypothetical protein